MWCGCVSERVKHDDDGDDDGDYDNVVITTMPPSHHTHQQEYYFRCDAMLWLRVEEENCSVLGFILAEIEIEYIMLVARMMDDNVSVAVKRKVLLGCYRIKLVVNILREVFIKRSNAVIVMSS